MIAVADTSPLCYLALIGEIDLLPAFFSEVLVPPGVAAELSDPRAPAGLRDWWEEPPPWIRIADPGATETALLIPGTKRSSARRDARWKLWVNADLEPDL